MPCLAVISSVAAIIATSLISRAYFNIAFVYFNDLVLNSLLIRDIVTGMLKSFLFGLLIGAIACYRGLNVKGGAAGVGTATTSSVVTAITAVIGFDTRFQHRLRGLLPMSAPTPAVVELRDVRLQFDEKKVLDGVSLAVEPLDRLVVMGQSGSGKSTILRLILGILAADRRLGLLQAI